MKLSEDQRVLFANTSIEMKGWSHDECATFFESCERAGLDPFSRQIYPMLRVDYQSGDRRVSAGVTIDGFRIIASRSGKYRGQVGPFWCGRDGEWRDVWLDDTTPPAAAKVGVLHADFAEPLWAVARFNDYKQTKKGGDLNMIWSKMGPTMVAKCAEALALRRAFPDYLSGLYTDDEEMVRTENPPPERAAFNPNDTKVAKKSPMELVKAAADRAGVEITVASKIDSKPEVYGVERGREMHAYFDKHDLDADEIRTMLIEQGTNPEEVAGDISEWPYRLSGMIKGVIVDIRKARKAAKEADIPVEAEG